MINRPAEIAFLWVSFLRNRRLIGFETVFIFLLWFSTTEPVRVQR